MKNKVAFLLVVILAIATANSAENSKSTESSPPVIKLMVTQQTTALANQLLNGYNNGAQHAATIALQSVYTADAMGMASESELKNQSFEASWRMLMARQVIVAVTSARNPQAELFLQHGLTPGYLKQLAIDDFNKSQPAILFPEDEELRSLVFDYLEMEASKVNELGIVSGEQIQISLQNNPALIAFCKLPDVLDMGQPQPTEGIQWIPIDKNSNGKLDYYESIYTDVNTLLRGVWLGKYPHELVQNIYLFSSGPPQDEASQNFASWLLTEGQRVLAQSGYVELTQNERLSKLELLQPYPEIHPESAKSLAIVKIVFAAFIGIALLVFAFNMLSLRRVKRMLNKDEVIDEQETIHAKNMNLPKGIYYDKSHTWAFMDEHGVVKIGVDDFIQRVTGPLTKIQMLEPGTRVKRNDPLVTINQNGKHLQLYAPVSGRIVEINEALVTEAADVNRAPYVQGWIYKLEPSNWQREIQFMSMADKYRNWLDYEFSRLKDFLAAPKGQYSLSTMPVVYQEGGALKNHVLMDMEPDVWEDFQKYFVDFSGLS